MRTFKNRHTRVLAVNVGPSGRWLVRRPARGPGERQRRLHPVHHRSRQSEPGDVQPSQCEDIYVMAPDDTNPVRLTLVAASPNDPAAYNSGGADWSHSKKLIAFQSNRVARVPQIHLMNLRHRNTPGGLPGGPAFPSFSQSGNELCFHGLRPLARHLHREHPRHRPDQPHQPRPSCPAARPERRQHPLRLVGERECDRIHQ